MANGTKYIPALRFAWLTRVYDPVLRRMMPEIALKQRLIAQTQIISGQRVLDLGAGTGTLTITIMIKQAYPDADVMGLDGDPEILALAREKAAVAGVAIRFDQGLATVLPYDDAAFDRVLSSLMLHHLTTEDKGRALREAWRVLRPGGELHVLDFGPPQNALAWLISLVFRRLELTADNIAGRLQRRSVDGATDDDPRYARTIPRSEVVRAVARWTLGVNPAGRHNSRMRSRMAASTTALSRPFTFSYR